MNYAIIRTGSKQYHVSEGAELVVDRLSDAGETMTFDEVLMVRVGDKVEVGTPTVANARVIAKLIAQEKGEKIRVSKFKAKVHYRRSTGFRAHLTRVKIEKIEMGETTSKTVKKTASK